MLPLPVAAMTKFWPLSMIEPPLTVEVTLAPVDESDWNATEKLRAIVLFCTRMVMFAPLEPLKRMPWALVDDPGHVVLENVPASSVRLTLVDEEFWMFT